MNASRTHPTSHGFAYSLRVPAAVLVVTLGAAAGVHAQMAPMAGPAASQAASMPAMDIKKSMESMHQQMGSMQMTGDADHDFAMMMRMHHQGAIKMAEAELANGKDPQMRKMAKHIIDAQKKEVSQLDGWLKKHGSMAKPVSK